MQNARVLAGTWTQNRKPLQNIEDSLKKMIRNFVAYVYAGIKKCFWIVPRYKAQKESLLSLQFQAEFQPSDYIKVFPNSGLITELDKTQMLFYAVINRRVQC